MGATNIIILTLIGITVVLLISYLIYRTLPEGRSRKTDAAHAVVVGPPITTEDTGAQIQEAVISQMSLFVGVIISLLLGILFDFIFGAPILRLLGMGTLFPAHLVIVVAVAALYFLWGLENVLVGWRAAILLFGDRRLKRAGQGLSEGYQWVPRPIMKLRQVDTREQNLDISDPDGAYSSDGVLMSTNAFIRFRVYDVYRFIGITDAKEALQRLGRQTMRNIMKTRTAVELRSANKVEFSDVVAKELEKQLDADGNPRGIKWGLDTGILVVDDIFATDDAINKAWLAKVREDAEGVAEAVQVARRAEQVREYIKMGASPDLAIVAAQTDVEKPGAKVTAVTVPWLKEATASIATAVQAGVTAALSRGDRK